MNSYSFTICSRNGPPWPRPQPALSKEAVRPSARARRALSISLTQEIVAGACRETLKCWL